MKMTTSLPQNPATYALYYTTWHTLWLPIPEMGEPYKPTVSSSQFWIAPLVAFSDLSSGTLKILEQVTWGNIF